MDVDLVFRDLAPDPRDEWRRLLRFVGWGERDRQAAARSIEPLLRRGPELIAATYDHLASVPETAAILGWEEGVDPAHLQERRGFLTVWLARTLGLDTSDELAAYLFQVGIIHAGHGPRGVHVPPEYVTASVGMIQAGFARILGEEGMPADIVMPAMAAWSRYLAVQLDLMLLGYRAARALSDGPLRVRCTAYGRLRRLIGGQHVDVAMAPGTRLGTILCKVFDYYPEVRAEALDRIWDEPRATSGASFDPLPAYVPRQGWRVLLNGRDTRYQGGLAVPVAGGDEVALFPPGR
ncbi:MAG: hypothetical protein IT305_25000 [Chloroflexi bacterium]|nr:hypothetical protein [Chloroflexota bacterium]